MDAIEGELDSSETITWTYATLPTDTTVALTFSVTLPPLPAGLEPGDYGDVYLNVATFSSGSVDPGPTNEVKVISFENVPKPPPAPHVGADIDGTTSGAAAICFLMAAAAAVAGTRKR